MSNHKLTSKDVLPVSLKMRAANKTKIYFMGALIVNIKRVGPLGSDKETMQVVYIAKDAPRVPLSQEACKNLWLVHDSFPHVEVNSRTVLTQSTPTILLTAHAWSDPPHCPSRSSFHFRTRMKKVSFVPSRTDSRTTTGEHL